MIVELRIFNVEHGACALLTCDNGKRLMIDCGHNASTGWTPSWHLQRMGISTLDVLMITNYDEDHVSGLRDLDTRLNINWLFRNTSVSGATLQHLKSESGIGANIAHLANRLNDFTPSANPLPHFPGVTWEVYYNNYPIFDDENNLSMVVSLNVNGVKFLFSGDMERAGWITLLNKSPKLCTAVTTTDVLIASHHGRENGICEEMFDILKCKPSIVIISDDYRQYDTQNTTQYYASKAQGIIFRGRSRYVLTTRNDGEINFVFSETGCFVQ